MNSPGTPKTHNCNKRGRATMTMSQYQLQQQYQQQEGISPNTAIMVVEELYCADAEDEQDSQGFQSLQRSLKRMKVTSASPGELRLQRDLKHAVHTKGWLPVAHTNDQEWTAPFITTTTHHHRYSANGNHTDNNNSSQQQQWWIRIRQSSEDPLKLSVHFADWTIFMDVPRLYPHRPPVIRLLHPAISPPSTTAAPSSAFGCHPQLVLQATPEDVVPCQGTLVVRGWSPLLRLDEIIQLILPTILAMELADASADNDSSGSSFMLSVDENHQDFLIDQITNGPTPQQKHLQPRTTTHQQQQQQRFFDNLNDNPSSSMDLVSVDSMGEFLFPPNRFDLGYARVDYNSTINNCYAMMDA